jgi:hypothetical protein
MRSVRVHAYERGWGLLPSTERDDRSAPVQVNGEERAVSFDTFSSFGEALERLRTNG